MNPPPAARGSQEANFMQPFTRKHAYKYIIFCRWDCPVKKSNREKEESVSGPIMLKISSIPPYAYVDNESKRSLGERGLSIRRNLDELSVFFPKVTLLISLFTAHSSYSTHLLIPAHQ